MPTVPDKLRNAAQEHLHGDSARWWVRDVTRSYGDLGIDGLYWLIDSNDRSVIVAERADTATALKGPQGRSLAGDLLSRAFGGTPWDRMGVARFAKTLASWFSDPRLHLTDAEFLRKQERVIDTWLVGREKNPDAFRALRREARLERAGANWTLDFQVINRRGGVDAWVVEGSVEPFQVRRADVTVVHPEGTFYFPDEL